MIIKAIIIFKQQILTLSNTNLQKLDYIWSAETSDLNQRLYRVWFPTHYLTLWVVQYITCKFHPSNTEWNLFFYKCYFSSYHSSKLNYLLKSAEKPCALITLKKCNLNIKQGQISKLYACSALAIRQ